MKFYSPNKFQTLAFYTKKHQIPFRMKHLDFI